MKPSNGVGRKPARVAVAVTAAAAATVALTAFGSNNANASAASPTSSGMPAKIAAALTKPSTITVWSWAPQTKAIVAGFEKKYPDITVNLVNAGTGGDEYTKLQNAIKAGSGAPDVAQIEYYALPQFALTSSLANLGSLGLGTYKSDFSKAVWDSVDINGKLDGMPQDTGPMALFYNQKIFKKYHLAVPKTWAQYVADAKKLHRANPKEYITNDAGDAGFVTSMIWDAGGHPYKVSGTTKVNINLQDAGSKKFATTWNKLLDGGLLSPIASWSSQWYTGLSNGTIASLVTGAWMPGNLESGVPKGKGDWRVAPMPTWTAGGKAATSENGGSSDAILQQSTNKLVAAGFLAYENELGGAKIFADQGGFPSQNHLLDSKSFLNQAPAYFGKQKINKVLSKAAGSVISGWSYLPFQVYANSIFSDTVGKSYANKSNINTGLKAWQSESASYGTQEGFTVTQG